MNERGVTLIESLIAMALGSVLLLGIGSFYVATVRSSRQDSAQTFLQNQAVWILEEMARQIRPATALIRGGCNGDPNSLQATRVIAGNPVHYCFYKNGTQFNEDAPGGTANLLAGSPVPLTVSSFVSSPIINGRATTISLQLQDNAQNSMMFTTSIGRSN
jgi:prepilin-type N-terminal cleavage/methylation domain-containing protein